MDDTKARREQSRIQQQRNAQTLRVGRISNGYLVTEGDTAEQTACINREEMHAKVDDFFDRLERQGPCERIPDMVDHRVIGTGRDNRGRQVSPINTNRENEAIMGGIQR